MYWATLTAVLVQKMAVFESPPFPSELDGIPMTQLAEKLFEMEERLRPDVDACARQFARTWQWPQPTTTERWLLSHRMDRAILVAGALAVPFRGERALVPEPEAEQEDVIEWLLIDQWKQFGILHWQEDMRRTAQVGAEIEAKRTAR